jgi:hypothetical protein
MASGPGIRLAPLPLLLRKFAPLGIPKTILWIGLFSCCLLAGMTSYRLLSHSLLHIEPAALSLGEAAWIGFRFDCRYVSLFALTVLLLSFLPGLHPFRSHRGKAVALALATVFTGILLALYATDFILQLAFEQRLHAASLEKALANPDEVKGTPWVILVLIAGVSTWLMRMVAKGIHRLLAKQKAAGLPALRVFWQVLTILVLLAWIHGSFSSVPLTIQQTQAGRDPVSAAFVSNPFESLLRGPSQASGTK